MRKQKSVLLQLILLREKQIVSNCRDIYDDMEQKAQQHRVLDRPLYKVKEMDASPTMSTALNKLSLQGSNTMF